MIGHQGILKLRFAGKKPQMVFIIEDNYATDWEKYGDYPTICIRPEEAVELLDLRFLVGLGVSITSTSETRSRLLCEVCKRYCDTVAASHLIRIPNKTIFTTGWSEIWTRG